MSILDGLPSLFDSALKSVMYEATLERPVTTGGDKWNPATGAAGTGKDTGRGFVEEYSDYAIANSLAREKERKVTLMMYSFKKLQPQPEDQITIQGDTYVLVGPVKSDPAKATATFKGRKL